MTWTVYNRDGSVLATVEGWKDRYHACPLVRDQATRATRGGDHVLLYRGQASIPHREQLFLLGLKARPLYHGGDRTKLERKLKKLATDVEWFRELADSFIASDLGRRSGRVSDQLVQRFGGLGADHRVLLVQVLLETLQYQNCKPPARNWRDYLFLLSSTTRPEVAAMYALHDRPMEAFVLEYAAPRGRNLCRSVADFRAEYSAMGLGEAFRDQDSEFFVRYAMLPHYLLGYTHLQRPARSKVYSATYVPNPVYADGSATLDNPPDLNSAQEQIYRDTLPDIAWVFNVQGGPRRGWGQIHTPAGIEPLDPPNAAERLERSTFGRSRTS